MFVDTYNHYPSFTPSDANNSLSVTGAGSAFSSLGDILVGAASMSDPNPQPKNSLLAVELGGRVSTPGGLAIGGTSTLRVGAGASVSARDLALQTGSALEIGVDADAAGVIALAGTARLNGTLAASFTGESFQKSYTILSADQAVTGAFASYTAIGLPAFFSSALSYGPAEVTLTVAADFALVPGLTPNESAVGTALTGIINAPGSTVLAALPAALSPLYALDASQLPQALDALSGESYASQEAVLLGDSLYSRLALMGRLRQGAYAGQSDALAMLSNGGPTLTTSTKGTGLAFMSQVATTWGQVYGSRTDLDGQADTSDVTSNFGGVMTGADTQIENWLVGAALGYSQSSTNVDDLSSSSDVDSLTGALYGGTSNGPWNVRLGASYASNQTEATRTIAYPGYAEQASADYDSATTQVFAEVAYGMAVGTAAIEPFAGLAWINVDTDGFSETGASAGLSVSSSSSSVTYGTLGVRAATNVEMSDGMVLQPRGSLALQTASGDLSPSAQMAFLSAPGTGFTVGGAPLAENTGLIELGADLLISEQARLGLSYIGQYADGVSTYGIQASMTWTF